MKRPFALVGAGVAATVLAVAGIAGVAAQTSDGGSATSGSPVSAFVDKLAGKLGIGSDQLTTAIEQTRNEMLDQAVADGSITADQAAKLKQMPLQDFGGGKGFEFKGVRPDGGTFEFRGSGTAPDGASPHLERKAFVTRGGPMALETAAEAIGIDAATLKTELASGKTLAQVAADHGVSRDQLKGALLDKVSANLDTLLDQTFPTPVERGDGSGRSMPSPNATATPQS